MTFKEAKKIALLLTLRATNRNFRSHLGFKNKTFSSEIERRWAYLLAEAVHNFSPDKSQFLLDFLKGNGVWLPTWEQVEEARIPVFRRGRGGDLPDEL